MFCILYVICYILYLYIRLYKSHIKIYIRFNKDSSFLHEENKYPVHLLPGLVSAGLWLLHQDPGSCQRVPWPGWRGQCPPIAQLRALQDGSGLWALARLGNVSLAAGGGTFMARGWQEWELCRPRSAGWAGRAAGSIRDGPQGAPAPSGTAVHE